MRLPDSLSGVIVGVAFCPHPPALIPVVAGGVARDLAAVLAAGDVVTAGVTAGVDSVVILGAGAVAGAFPSGAWGTLAGFGVDVTAGMGGRRLADATLPLALTIGCWLVARTAHPPPIQAVAVLAGDRDASVTALLGLTGSGRHGLLVMGDGSARHGEKAPGYSNSRAEAFEESVRRTLAAGDAVALAELDESGAAELLAAGGPSWRVAATALLMQGAGRWSAQLLYSGQPFGVGYHVASWRQPPRG